MSPRPILILSAGRSGSHLLRSFFQPNASIFDVREFLSPSATAHGPQGFWSQENPRWAVRLRAESPSNPKARYALARDYVGFLIAEGSDRTVLADLKYHHNGPLDALWRMPDEPPPIVKAFLEADAAVLHLVRANPLAQLCSLMLGMKSGVWYRPAGGDTEQETPTITLSVRDLQDSLRRIEFRKAAAEFWLSRHRRTLTLTYESLLDRDQLAPPIRKEIGALVGPRIDLTSRAGSQKIAPPLVELIANIDDVRRTLRDSEFAWCLEGTHTANDSAAIEAPRATPTASARTVILPIASRAASPASGSVLICRELPAALGGSIDLPALAERFRSAGMEPILVLPAERNGLTKAPDFCVLQAPLWPALAAGQITPGDMDYAHLLATIGFTDEAAVRAMANAWRGLVETIRPAAIVAEHAPALVTALGRGSVPVVHLGSAVTSPPIMATGFPRLRAVRSPLPPVSRMLAAVRTALGESSSDTTEGIGPAGKLAELFKAHGRVVVGFPELDPYRSLRAEDLASPPEACGSLPAPSRERRLIAFLPAEFPHREIILDAVARATGHAENVDPPGNVSDLHSSLARASHVLCLAGSSVSIAAFAAARPQLMIPSGIVGRTQMARMQHLQVGQPINPREASTRLAVQIRNFMTSPIFLEQAAVLAEQIRLRRMREGQEMTLETVARLIAQTTPAAF